VKQSARSIFAVAALAALALPFHASAECGERGGPGYRGPNGQCVGWANIGKICGSPPTTHCTPERANPNALPASEHGQEIEKLRPSGSAVPLMAQPTPATDLAQCAKITDSAARLKCFDGLAASKK
jgi:hypothetical protein